VKTGAAPTDDDLLIQEAGVALLPGTRVTPMLRQWLAAKAKAKDAILLFRMGDFYELFGDDAKVAGGVLDLAVTTRDRDKGENAMPMAGFPHPAAPGYIARLIGAGFKVAVCDQLEDPAMAKGIVKRGVTRVVTPGMVIDDESLDAASNNFLVAVVTADNAAFGVCAVDVSTGEIMGTVAANDVVLRDELGRLSPRELVTDAASADVVRTINARPGGGTMARLEVRDAPNGRRLLGSLGTPDRWLHEQPLALLATELALFYIEETGQGRLPRHLRPPVGYALDDRLILDATTRAHLAVAGPPGDTRRAGTLLWHIDRTKSAAGGRRLLRRLLAPSVDVVAINAELDRVEALVAASATRARLAEALTAMGDVERLVARVCAGRAGPREVLRLGRAAARLPVVAAAVVDHDAFADDIVSIEADINNAANVADSIVAAIVDDAPAVLGDDRAFKVGYDDDLDALWALTSGGQGRIAELEARERQSTGIPTLKVRFNSVFGYFLEVTKAHQGKVPAHYRRKQTIANGERYTTEELSGLQEEVEGADGRRRRREGELFHALLEKIAASAPSLLALASFAAGVDATLSFAEVAVTDQAVRPTLLEGAERRLELREARHPVVARLCAERGEAFVPSSITLDDQRQIVVVTGPNMAGKSTMMRQVAVCQLLAQAGAFVPAQSASLSVCDRIYTRVGADDDAVTGRSTFMVEMTETSNILRGATPQSLVLLDEIGRGTSTFDGLAIAWAVVEYLHEHVGARALFATHYHELTSLDRSLSRLKNLHVVVTEDGDDIIFVRALREGPALQSFGIQVARLAGLPDEVVARARQVLGHLERETSPPMSASTLPLPPPKTTTPQLGLFAARPVDTSNDNDSALVARLREIDVNGLTPVQALSALDDLVRQARRRSN
jgi:DNA mismatch repair protein MutS